MIGLSTKKKIRCEPEVLNLSEAAAALLRRAAEFLELSRSPLSVILLPGVARVTLILSAVAPLPPPTSHPLTRVSSPPQYQRPCTL
ncbi:hypothetical protein J6590_053164 [Homalodisca vitripennis]|nr:hypothetical protein J6590_053164 [Homalodisca vitripennis]